MVLRERASVSSADGVDIRGRCLTSTEAPRKVAMIWMDRKKIEAELSWGTLLLSHPKTKASCLYLPFQIKFSNSICYM